MMQTVFIYVRVLLSIKKLFLNQFRLSNSVNE